MNIVTYERPAPKVSLCMIVRNAEDTLPRLLESIAGHFDEYVFVDTGSTDNTCALIRAFLRPDPNIGNLRASGWVGNLHHFEWVDDFAAARQFAFEQASMPWRMYLDADDELINGRAIRAEIEACEKHRPEANAIMFPYTYRDGDAEQEVLRVVRWADGWKWQDEVHEFLECPQGRKRVVVTGIQVLHHKSFAAGIEATERNARIAQKAYNATTDAAKKARMAAYLGAHANVTGDLDIAVSFYKEAIKQYNGVNFAVYTYEDLIRLEIRRGRLDEALALASELAGRHPEHVEGPLTLCVVHELLGAHWRAVQSWEAAQRVQPIAVRALENVWWTQGVANVRAAQAYLGIDSYDGAVAALSKVPANVAAHPEVRHLYTETRAKISVQFGVQKAREWKEFLLWTNEPEMAHDVTLPPVLQQNQSLFLMDKEIEKRVAHVTDGQQAYIDTYAAIPGETYHTSAHHRGQVLNLARTRVLLQEVRAIMSCTPPPHVFKVLSVGYQDGIIEQAMLEIAENIELTVADVAPQASQGFEELNKRFPGRVTRHRMHGIYDISPGEGFDAVICFEVIEHVPEPYILLHNLFDALKADGLLFLSTPASRKWIENHHSDFKRPDPFWHVRSYTHTTLFHELDSVRPGAQIVDMIEAEDNTFVVTMSKERAPRQYVEQFTIFVPSTPLPFDARSLERGFLGGSEEAVVRLAHALTEQGVDVVVYAPQPMRDDNVKLRVHHGVLWCEPDEFIPEDHSTVLYWRCPSVMRSALVQSVPHRRVLWLHDAYYGAPAADYAAADTVLVLSEAHKKSLMAHDGADAKNIEMFGNGIDPNDFPQPDERERDQYKVIYASSPERGLETLLDVWSEIEDVVPQASLDIYYDWTAFKDGLPNDYTRIKEKMDRLRGAGRNVAYYGGVDQPTLHAAMRKAGVWAYPNQGEVETYCITAVKMQAAGVWPVASDAGALREVISREVPLFPAERLQAADGPAAFADLVITALREPPSIEQRFMLRRFAVERFSWAETAKRLLKIATTKGRTNTIAAQFVAMGITKDGE